MTIMLPNNNHGFNPVPNPFLLNFSSNRKTDQKIKIGKPVRMPSLLTGIPFSLPDQPGQNRSGSTQNEPGGSNHK